jgi:hypothetical protein
MEPKIRFNLQFALLWAVPCVAALAIAWRATEFLAEYRHATLMRMWLLLIVAVSWVNAMGLFVLIRHWHERSTEKKSP